MLDCQQLVGQTKGGAAAGFLGASVLSIIICHGLM